MDLAAPTLALAAPQTGTLDLRRRSIAPSLRRSSFAPRRFSEKKNRNEGVLGSAGFGLLSVDQSSRQSGGIDKSACMARGAGVQFSACMARGAGVQFSGASTPFLRVGTVFPHRIDGRNGVTCAAAASKKNAFVYPPMTSKPRWWLRSLACAPYLVPLHEAWSYASHVYRLHPYMEKFDFLVDPFLVTYSMVPRWFLMVIFFVVYYFVGRRKELPHFLRFHIFLALLMSQAVGAVAMISGWMPGVLFKGRMTYLWAAFTFVEIMTVLHCMKCSLRGMYSDVPFISDSTYINLSL